MLAGVEPHVMRELERAGLLDPIGRENVFAAHKVLESSLNEALDAALKWLQQNKEKAT